MKYLGSLERLIFNDCESLSLNLNMEMEEEGNHHDRNNVRPHLQMLYVAGPTPLLELPQRFLQGSSKTLQMKPYSHKSGASEISLFFNKLGPKHLTIYPLFCFFFPKILQLSLERFSQTAETVNREVQRLFNLVF